MSSSSRSSWSLLLCEVRVLAEDGREDVGREDEAEKGRLADDGRSEVGIPTLGLIIRPLWSSAEARDLTLDLNKELAPIGEGRVFHLFPVGGPPTAVCRKKLISWFKGTGVSDMVPEIASSPSPPQPRFFSCGLQELQDLPENEKSVAVPPQSRERAKRRRAATIQSCLPPPTVEPTVTKIAAS
jgi:hypothetical protein